MSAIKSVVGAIVEQVGQEVFGQENVVELLAAACIIGGHVLIEGPPGIAKTRTARSVATALGLRFRRIQFTPDLMPSDITGVHIFDPKQAEFRFVEGPIFTDILLADEINRTPPKTQSALLEAMEERRVTTDGASQSLGEFFFVVATQNPIEHEGTFPLPEAQLDRFLFKVPMSYPERSYEIAMVHELSGIARTTDVAAPAPVSIELLREARASLPRILLDRSLAEYIVQIVEATRSHSELILGASPRAALNLALAAKCAAALDSRSYVIPDDVQRMVPFVLAHRVILDPVHLQTDTTAERVLASIVGQVPVGDSRG